MYVVIESDPADGAPEDRPIANESLPEAVIEEREPLQAD